jgi:ABC-type nickel/cobalt efflux system permease component RcnA
MAVDKSAVMTQEIIKSYNEKIIDDCRLCMGAYSQIYCNIMHTLAYEYRTKVIIWLTSSGLLIGIAGLAYRDYVRHQKMKKYNRRKPKICLINKETQTEYWTQPSESKVHDEHDDEHDEHEHDVDHDVEHSSISCKTPSLGDYEELEIESIQSQ